MGPTDDASGPLQGALTEEGRAVPAADASGAPRRSSDGLLDTPFDAAGVDAALAEVLASTDEGASRRRAATEILRTALDAGRAAIEHDFHDRRRPGLDTARRLAALTDGVVTAAFRFAADGVHHLPVKTTAEQVALAAVGGYGRGEMAPYSDVDLLFLTPYKRTGWSESVVETTLYILWDLKLKVGHATRTAQDCVRRAAGDITIRTSLLEKRFLCGSSALVADLDQRLWRDLFSRTGPDFVEAKLAERDARHERTGGSRYLLEPNIKESKGGLRDLQTLLWISKYLYRAEAFEELVERSVFTREELARCHSAAAHLWTVRCGLHYLARRGQEKLTFDAQVELAERFGYHDRRGQRAVERFMKRYFLAAKEVGDLTRIFCAALEEQHKKSQPGLGGLRRLFGGLGTATPLEDGFCVRNGRIDVEDPARFEKEPVAMLRLIQEGVARGVLIHPNALRQIGRNRRRIDDAFRSDPEARRLLVEVIGRSKDPVRALRRLSETGVLGRMIPEFGRVTGQMQFNMYHHYTVDEHTILTIDILMRLIDGRLKDEHPIESEIAAALPDRRALTFALLFHDIGKGLPEDHSIAGERIARQAGPALGLEPAEVETIAWLVRHHLVMSDVAQKRDVNDPATVRAFADLVRSPQRLKLLYVLTACDIRAVGPGVWNGWKAQLLRHLYQETWGLLTGEAAGLSRSERIDEAQAALRERLASWSAPEFEAHVARFFPTYWLGLTPASHEAHARMLAEMPPATPHGGLQGGGAPFRMDAAPSPQRAATRVSFVMPDHAGLFARMAGAFALAGASVVDARAYTTKDGMAANTFWVQDEDGEPYDDPDRLEQLRNAVSRTVGGEVAPREALTAKRKLRARERSFDVTPTVVFDNDASDLYTVIEVNGRDRVGLLYDLSRALSDTNVNIASAIIATYGEHAVDVFYAKDLFGMKITAPGKQRRIEESLMAALARNGVGAGR